MCLIDSLSELFHCMYISDLPAAVAAAPLQAYLMLLPICSERVSAHEWNDTLSYLTGTPMPTYKVADAKKRLLHFLWENMSEAEKRYLKRYMGVEEILADSRLQ